MKITDIIWLTRFVEKIEHKHSVSRDEVEQIFANRPSFRFIEGGNVSGENVYRAIGKTDGGRYLTIFFIYKRGNRALVISARDCSAREKKSYGKQKK
ncbi:MAG TPA: BrnT family toxin [Pyrinomonadaceae bacterium]|nr:BrnT family toxin [Pyrinomonadaceae bacterium]